LLGLFCYSYDKLQNHLADCCCDSFADNAGVIVNPKGEMKGNNAELDFLDAE
jgi:hypothetical protein